MGDNEDWWKSWLPPEPQDTSAIHKCECGASITMGKDDDPQWHSDYCPLKEPSKYIIAKGPIKERNK